MNGKRLSDASGPFCIDSRETVQGGVFFALRGARVDGHAFLREVAASGAKIAVVEKGYSGEAFGLELAFVEDVTQTLQELARKKIERMRAVIVGITGSVGKTTTKEFLSTLLANGFTLFSSPKSYNSQVTLPLNILNATGMEEVMVLEMAMSQKGDIARLTQIAPVDFALITKIGRAHTQFFSDGIEGVARAKGEILESYRLQKAVIGDEAMGFAAIGQRGGCAKVVFGGLGSDYVLEKRGEMWCVVERGQNSPFFSLPFSATHLCFDFLGAAALCRELGLEWDVILARVGELRVPQRRFEVVMRGGVTFINDCYNASAESTIAALCNLPRPKEGGKVVFVFGEMRELGDLSEVCHREVGQVAADVVDHMLCLGNGCSAAMREVEKKGKRVDLYEDLESLQKALFRMTSNGDVVLIKGANSHGLWRIIT